MDSDNIKIKPGILKKMHNYLYKTLKFRLYSATLALALLIFFAAVGAFHFSNPMIIALSIIVFGNLIILYCSAKLKCEKIKKRLMSKTIINFILNK
jgi:hypothetical protein